MRTEQEIFDDLSNLCTSPGYAHVIAYFCLRDNIVGFRDELKAEDYAKLYSPERLTRTEISTLIGLMAQQPIDLTLPSPSKVAEYIRKSEALLEELHQALSQPFIAGSLTASIEEAPDPFESAKALREPIFYSAESAYPFQYRDFAPLKYARDKEWLLSSKGFSAEDARALIAALIETGGQKVEATVKKLAKGNQSNCSPLEAFTFSISDIANNSDLNPSLIACILEAFTFPNDGNPTFKTLQDFNSTNAYPLLKSKNDQYILFQYASLIEALYETPYYWMANDPGYEQVAMANRGQYTEEFAIEKLTRVFGAEKVFRSVDVWASRRNKLTEIDVLVLFADHAIVVQAKSKRLTLAARKGNDFQLKSDFKAAVQDACDQAFACGEQIAAASLRFTDATGNEIQIPKLIRNIYPVCLVSDHYPALSFQVRQFLKFRTTDVVKTPLVCDVFLLDVLTEFLDSPVRYLSYLELRAMAGENLMATHEVVALGYHLRQNLWLGEYDFMQLGDELAADVDIAMAVRRDGVPGNATPPGILTEFRSLTIGRILDELENRADAVAVNIGLQLLKLSGQATVDLSRMIDKIARDAASDGRHHDAIFALGSLHSGIVVHCSNLNDPSAAEKLRRHCEIRKYSERATTWFGIAIEPGSGALRFYMMLDFPWQRNHELERAAKRLREPIPINALRRLIEPSTTSIRKTGRNDPCPCGSGLKYKKCCLLNQS